MAATVQGEKRGDDLVGGTPFDLGAAQTAKGRARVPEILLGTLLVALFALGGAWFYSSSTDSDGYVALRADVQRGEQIETSDLVVVQLKTEDELELIPARDFRSIVGKLALADLAAGTLVAPQQFADRVDIPSGQGVVGLSLSAGEYPTTGLRPGDRVRVVAVPNGAAAGNEAAEVLDPAALVTEVIQTGGDTRFISLTTDTEVADRVAAVEAEDRVRLIQVPTTDAAELEDAATDEEAADTDDAAADAAAGGDGAQSTAPPAEEEDNG
ncbi:MAG: SAF domain-containing protein [Actinomycetota bacterium]